MRTADWRRARDQSNAPGEGACIASGVEAAIIGAPLDLFGYAVHPPYRCSTMANIKSSTSSAVMPPLSSLFPCLAVTVVDCECDTHLLAIVTGDHQPAGAPAGVAQRIYWDAVGCGSSSITLCKCSIFLVYDTGMQIGIHCLTHLNSHKSLILHETQQAKLA